MTLREIEISMSEIVVALHDLARACPNPAIQSYLRRLGHDANILADRVRQLLAARALLPLDDRA